MALQVWLPLTGNLKNLGLDDITVTNNGATINTAGKIGSCYNGTASGQTIIVTVPDLAAMLSNGKKYTFTCWVKMNSAAANTNQWIVKLGTNTCGFWWGYSSPRFVWNENNNGTRVADGETTSWHHFAVVVDKTVSGRITIWNYMDGTPVSGRQSYSWDSSSQAQPAGDTITIYPYMAFLNDLRIYDSCLSPKEVKELSKGLVAHYPLNDQEFAFNDSVIHDCSGYGHNGSIVNTTSVTSDAPRYKVTTYFNSGAYVRIDNIQSGNLEDSYTMAYWAKIANGKIPCGYRDGNRLNIYITNGLICCNTGDGNQNPFQLNGASINVEQYYNEWHHYAMSGDGFESKLYIDGEYKGSAKTYRPMTGTHFVINGWDFNTSYKINYISDVRIYATALFAEDIKFLYETRASIDDYGNTYAYEFMEV